MARPTSRRSLRFENLEDRQLLSSAAPTNEQQLALQLINMARTTPQVAVQWLSKSIGSDVSRTLQHYNVDVNAVKATIASNNPLPPVAWNSELADAAQSHSQDMAANGFQSHTGSDGSTPDSRIKAAGYKADSTGENAFAYANNVDNAMQAFLYDWGVADSGHRRNLLQPGVAASDSFTDVGVGVVNGGSRGSNGRVGPVVVTQKFASSPDAKTQLVGVVYSDDDANDFYTPGEGKGGVEINATNLDTGTTKSTKSWDSGGYQLPLSTGRYQVTASEADVVIKQVEVTVSKTNVAQNFRTNERWDGRTLRSALPTAPAADPAKSEAAPPVRVNAVPTPVATTSSSSNANGASTLTSIDTPASAASNVNVGTTTASSNSKLAFFAPSDWKGPGSSNPTAIAHSPLSEWTTWKAKAR